MRCVLPALLATLVSLVPARAAALPAGASADLAAACELYTARRDAEAQSAFERILATEPANHEAVYHLGRLAKRRGDWATTAKQFERCTELAPASALYWIELGDAYGKLAAKAGIFQQLGLARKCRTALEKAVALAPDEISYREGLIEFYEKAPAIAGGGHDKALAQAAAIAQRDPFTGAMIAGGIRTRAHRWTEAEAAYRLAAQNRPDSTEPAAAIGLLYEQQGRLPEAFAQFDQLLARHPENFQALYQFGRLAAVSGLRLADGEAALRHYLLQPNRPAGQPTNAHAQYRLGDILARKGDTTAARAAYEESLRLDPGLKAAAAALEKLPPPAGS